VVAFTQHVLPVAGHKDKRHGAPAQKVGEGKDLLATLINVENRPVDGLFLGQAPALSRVRAGPTAAQPKLISMSSRAKAIIGWSSTKRIFNPSASFPCPIGRIITSPATKRRSGEFAKKMSLSYSKRTRYGWSHDKSSLSIRSPSFRVLA
jgi:hypothetical protein